MGTPLHLWLTDDGNTPMRGSSEVSGREGSIEVLSVTHGVHAPVDHQTGRLMGLHSHRPLTIEKGNRPVVAAALSGRCARTDARRRGAQMVQNHRSGSRGKLLHDVDEGREDRVDLAEAAQHQGATARSPEPLRDRRIPVWRDYVELP